MRPAGSIAKHGMLLVGAVALSGLIGVAAIGGGCEMNRTARSQTAPVEFSIQPSTRRIVEGEIVTFTTRTANVYGPDVDIEWSTTGGELEVEGYGRVARVYFPRAGTYTVTALLMIDGVVARTDTTDITVRPL